MRLGCGSAARGAVRCRVLQPHFRQLARAVAVPWIPVEWAGFVPHHTREVPMGQMKEFAGVYYREGALDPKTMQLVARAAMAAAGCTS